MKNITKLTSAQLASQRIEQGFDKLGLRASGIINDLTSTLTDLEDQGEEHVQALLDLWGNQALGFLMRAKNIATQLEGLSSGIIHLRPDFAIPEMDGTTPTGKLTYNPPTIEEGLEDAE